MDANFTKSLRTRLWVAARWAGVTNQTLHRLDSEHVAVRKFYNERPAMRAELGYISTNQWLDEATPTEIADTVEMLTTWEDRDPRARQVLTQLAASLIERFGIDIDDPLEGGALATWGMDGTPDPIDVDRERRDEQLQRSISRGAPLIARQEIWLVARGGALPQTPATVQQTLAMMDGVEIEPDNVLLVDDGWEFIRANRLRGWTPQPSWGADGYSIGTWPSMVFMTSDEFDAPQALVFNAGEVEVREFGSAAERNAWLDRTAEMLWRAGASDGPRDIAAYRPGQLPERYRGAPAAAPTASLDLAAARPAEGIRM